MDDNPYKQTRGLERLWKACGYSLAGLRAAYRHEAAFRQEVGLCLILMPLAWWLGQTGMERALLIFSIGLVLVTELLNSAIEAVVDRISLERHPLAGRAKDIGSAAVMVAIAFAALVWGCILIPFV